MLQEEGLENSWARHRKHHLALRAGLDAIGLEFYVREPHRLPQLNAIIVPAGVDDADSGTACSTSTTSKSAPASARSPARSCALASWATAAT